MSSSNSITSIAGRENVKTKVLHLVGSSTSDFYFSLSVLYANECMKAARNDEKTTSDFEFSFALVHPDPGSDTSEGNINESSGYSWSFPQDLDESTIKGCKRYSRAEGIAKFGSLQPDIVVPHMFCYAGLTHFRTLCDLFEYEFLGPKSSSQEISENKAWSKAIFEKSGVPVAPGERLVLGEIETPTTISLPFVVKPCCEGNSAGISLCSDESEVKAALDEAFSYDNEVLVEKFVPLGRELRISCIEEENGSVTLLPGLEYFLPASIRTAKDKLQVADEGKEVKYAPTKTQYPADIDDELMKKLEFFAKKAHKSINSRDFSIFDVRVDPDGNPFFIEASLYCSFAPKSALVWMASGVIDHQTLFRKMLLAGAKRGQLRKESSRASSGDQRSMKGKILNVKKD